jgi:tetratricopeptide (TPR) repeat protein
MSIKKWFGAKGKRKAEVVEEDSPASIFNAALSLHKSGRFLDAYPLYMKALKGFELSLEKDSDNTQFQSDVATTRNNLGNLLRDMGRLEEARDMYSAALAMYEQLLKSDLDNSQFQSYVAGTRNNLGALLRDMGRLEEAREFYAAALARLEQLLKSDPDNSQFQSYVAGTRNNLGALLSDMGRLEEAREFYAAALAMREQLLKSDPDNSQFQSDVATTRNNLGALLSGMDRLEEARDMYSAALAMREQLLNSDPDNSQFQSYVATTRNNLGALLSGMGRLEEARDMYSAALAMREQLLNSDPDNSQFQSDVAMTRHNLGVLLSDMGRLEEARDMYESALELVKGQKNTHFTGCTLSLLGLLDLERDEPDLETARSFLESSIEKLHKDIRPHYPNALNWLALCYYKLGEEKKKEARKEKSQDRAKGHVSESSQFFALSFRRYKEAYELPYARMPNELLIDAYMADTFASSVQIISEDDDQTAVDILDESIEKIENAVEQAKNNEAQRIRVEGARQDLLAKRSIRSVSLFKDEKEKQEFYLADAIDNFIKAAQNFEQIESDKTVASCQGCACLYKGLKKFKEGVMSDKIKLIADASKELEKASSFYQSAASEVGEAEVSSINEVITAINVYYDELNISLNEGRKPGIAEYSPVYDKISDLIEHVSAVGLRKLFKVYIFDDVMNLVDEKEPKQKKIEVIMGDKIENIQNSTIINRSVVSDSFNKIKEGYGEDVANALMQIAEFIEESGNKEAGELFDSFNNEIKEQEPKKSVLKSLWGGIEKALPAITAVSEAIIKLKTIF